MKSLFYIAFLVLLCSCGEIHEANRVREASYELSRDSLYDSASVQYRVAFDSLKLTGDLLRFNELSNRYHLKDTTVKQLYLALVSDSTFTSDSLKSKVYQQLGLLDIEKLKLSDISGEQLSSISIDETVLKSAINYTEHALRSDYTNTEARHNLELLYLIQDLDREQKDQNQDQNKDQKDNKKDQQNKNQENKDQKGDQKDQKNKDQQENGSDQKDQNKPGDNKEEPGKDGKQNKDQKKDGSGKDGQKKEEDKKGDQKEQKKQSGGDQKDKKEQQEKEGEPGSFKDQQEQQKAEQQKLINERLQEQGLSKEQMDQLLRSLNEQNKKYIQQIRKQPNQNTSDDGKPDW